MKAIIEIDNFDNDAMLEIDQLELRVDIRKKVGEALLMHQVGMRGNKLYDYNGNKVGEILIIL